MASFHDSLFPAECAWVVVPTTNPAPIAGFAFELQALADVLERNERAASMGIQARYFVRKNRKERRPGEEK